MASRIDKSAVDGRRATPAARRRTTRVLTGVDAATRPPKASAASQRRPP